MDLVLSCPILLHLALAVNPLISCITGGVAGNCVDVISQGHHKFVCVPQYFYTAHVTWRLTPVKLVRGAHTRHLPVLLSGIPAGHHWTQLDPQAKMVGTKWPQSNGRPDNTPRRLPSWRRSLSGSNLPGSPWHTSRVKIFFPSPFLVCTWGYADTLTL